MSSTGSAPMTLELPAWLLADRIVLVLAAACAVAIEAVLVRQPGGVPGAGLALGTGLAAWHCFRLRRRGRVQRARLAADGEWRLGFADGRTAPATLAPGSRLLGPSALLKWRVDGRSLALWLTPVDLPREAMRALRVRLSGADLRVGT